MSALPLQLPNFNMGDRVAWTENGTEHKGRFICYDQEHPDFSRVDPDDKRLLRDGENSVLVHPSQLRLVAVPSLVVMKKPEADRGECPPQPEVHDEVHDEVHEPVEEQKPETPKSAQGAPASDLRLETALRMANLGIPLIRLRPGTKLPLDNGWQYRATTDPETIRGWFGANPNTNYACVAKDNGFVFFEIDQPGVIERYETETGNKMPSTFLVQSRPGRLHYYFRQSDASRACGSITQKEIPFGSLRQNNAYVVGPLSIHPDTGLPYTIVNDVPIVPIPDTLVAWLDAQRTSEKSAKVEKGDAAMPAGDSGLRIEIDPELAIYGPVGAASGSRDNTLTSIAGGLRFHSKNGISYNELESILSTINTEHCHPPIDDPERIAKSISRKSYASVQEKHGVVIGGKFIDADEGRHIVGLRVTAAAKVEKIWEADPVATPPEQTPEEKAAQALGITVEEVNKRRDEPMAETKQQVGKTKWFSYFYYDDDGKKVKETARFAYPDVNGGYRDYVASPPLGQLDGWFPLGSPSVVAGSSGTGKTTLVMDLLEKQLAKDPACGHNTYGRPYVVIMVDRGEDSNKRTLERLGIDPDKVTVKYISPSSGAEAMISVKDKIEEDGPDAIPQIVFIEGADMLVQDVNKGPMVSEFLTRAQGLAKHYHLALILSVGSPKQKLGEGYVAKRDNILGSEKWGRMTETVVIMSYVKNDDMGKKRVCSVLPRNGPPEEFRYIMTQTGQLMPDTSEVAPEAVRAPEIEWFKDRAAEGKTDPTKQWWTALDLQRGLNVGHSTAGRYVKDSFTKKYIVKKRGRKDAKGCAEQYQWNESATNSLWTPDPPEEEQDLDM